MSAAPFQGFHGYDPDPRDDARDDARREAAEERREVARLGHWCTECRGMTGPGSPCYIDTTPTEE